jgi:hypothetical protein
MGWLSAAIDWKPLWFYLVPCWVLALVAIALWIQRTWLRSSDQTVLSTRITMVDVAAKLGHKPLTGWRTRLLSVFPGNQILKLSIEEKHVSLPRLPTRLDAFSIAHLSDLHITGHIGIDFFHEVVQQTNALGTDIIVLTGDIIDEIELFHWLPQTLAHLTAPHGVYFVLGNHDQFTGEAPRMRKILTDTGLIDVGGRWLPLEVAGAEIILAGNELPWFGPVADTQNCPPRSPEHPQLRILLSHSPDQFKWARRHDFDLMLAGHAHGGQIRLPLAGPIFCPSLHGVKYAGGTFYANPTLMHVNRGLSSELPLRLNCPPELTKIIVHPAST